MVLLNNRCTERSKHCPDGILVQEDGAVNYERSDSFLATVTVPTEKVPLQGEAPPECHSCGEQMKATDTSEWSENGASRYIDSCSTVLTHTVLALTMPMFS